MKKPCVLTALLCVFALTGCSHHATAPAAPPQAPPVPTAAPATTGNAPAVPAPVPHHAVIYTVNLSQGTDANNYLVPQTIPLRDPQDPAAEAVRALIAAPHSPIASGTTLNGIKITDGLATVDFTRSPVDETHGEEKQAQALEALQRTLGQFPNVSRIQVTVNGQALPALGEAAGGPMDVLRPGDTGQETGGA